MWRRSLNTTVTDLLVEGGKFDIATLVLRIDDRSVKFVPTFLYGQGVTRCVEATFHKRGLVTPLGRLFMRYGMVNKWTLLRQGLYPVMGRFLMKARFFGLILALLP